MTAGPPFPSPPPAPPRTRRQRLRLALLQTAGKRYRRHAHETSPRNVLLIRPDHLGDLLFLTPGLHALREALPDARITLLVGPWGADVVRGNPDVDAVILCPFPGFERRRKTSATAPYRLLTDTARRLRDGAFDTAVMLRFDHWWGAWLAAESGIMTRIGYDVPETRPFLTEVVRYSPDRHEVLQNTRLLRALAPDIATDPGPTRYAISERDEDWTDAWLRENGARVSAPLVAIHPGAGVAVKQWPPERWAAVAARLIEECDAQILLTGTAGERELTATLRRSLGRPVIDAAGATTLGQLAALLARCRLALGSDSGPLHLAVAVGTRTVHLYGPVDAAKFGPWGEAGRHLVVPTGWPCAPCNRLDWGLGELAAHACMAAIDEDRVWQAASGLLAGHSGPPGSAVPEAASS